MRPSSCFPCLAGVLLSSLAAVVIVVVVVVVVDMLVEVEVSCAAG